MASQRRDVDCEEGRGLIENEFDPPPSYDDQQGHRDGARAANPPNYQVAAKLPTYEESERTKGKVLRSEIWVATGFV